MGVKELESSWSGLKSLRIISLSVIMVFLIVFSAFAISDIGKSSGTNDQSSTGSHDADIDGSGTEGSYDGSINIIINTIKSQNESDAFLNDSTSTAEATQYVNSNEDQASSYYETSDGGEVDSQDDNSSYIIASSDCDCSNGATSKCSDCSGFIWMDINRIQNEIDTLILNRFYDEIDSNTYSVLNNNFDVDKFYDIIKIIKKYDWTDHRDYINSIQIKACQITVVGNDTVYTYLVFGRDENGKCFVWSFYDYKIAYPSEQDFEYIENIFLNVE